MSWDGKALVALMAVWATLSTLYVTVFNMAPGARGWGVGAVIFLALSLGVWYAERRGARATATQAETTLAATDVAVPRGASGESGPI